METAAKSALLVEGVFEAVVLDAMVTKGVANRDVEHAAVAQQL